MVSPDAPSGDLVEEVVANFAEQRPDIDPVTLETVCRIIVAARKLEDSAAAELRPTGLSYTDFDILGMLRTAPPPHELQPADLIRSVMMTSGAMTAALGRLERAGYIARRIGDRDRRSRFVSLTEEGRAVIDEALTRRFEAVARALAPFSGDSLQSLCRDLSLIARRLTDGPTARGS